MKMRVDRRKLRLYFSICLLTAAAVYWYDTDSNITNPSINEPVVNSQIDFFVTDAQFTRYDIQGKLANTLEASNVEHHQYAKQTNFSRPVLSRQTDAANFTTIRSEKAVALDGNGPISFSENVVVTDNKASLTATNVMSDTLNYDREKQLITTQDKVTIMRANGSKVTAIGMKTNLSLKKITLNKNVKGIIYEN